jgi:hypothetical protein
MNHERDIALLSRLLRATVAKSITWSQSEDGWYSCRVGGRVIAFRFLYFDATNQAGADPQIIDFMMPGRATRFACGTQGFDLLIEILEVSFGWKERNEFDPIKFWDEALPLD